MDDATRFGHLVQFRVPANLSAAIDTAAKQKCQSKSEYVRRSVIERLEADGVDPAHIVPRDAGALYDSRIERGKPNPENSSDAVCGGKKGT
jgi:hypothetical protein